MPLEPFSMSSGMFTIMPVFMMVVFTIIIGVIVFAVIKGVSKWNYNNSQPVLSVPARVISKRTRVDRSISNEVYDVHHINDCNPVGSHHHCHTYTSYFIAFEVESGSRMEFQVKDEEFGLLVENDNGKLTFQGSRYLGFIRNQAINQ